ncbi:MAG: tetratricopeptide repeat protein [Gemmatimonadota bacterium]|nr:tetratricopeptide repeat protein [Gemmatimonadota bacterium]
MSRLQTDVEHLLDHADWMNLQGQPLEAITVFGEVLDRLSNEIASSLQSKALRGVGLAFRTLGEINESQLAYEEALEVARACADPAEEAEALNGLAVAHQLAGQPAEAESLYEQAVQIAIDEGLFQLTGVLQQNRGVMASERGDFVSARECYRSALECFEAVVDTTGTCWTLNNLGLLSAETGHLIEALDYFDQAREVSNQASDRALGVRIEINRAHALMEAEEWELASLTLDTAVGVARTTNSPILVAEGLRYMAQVERRSGRPWNGLRWIRQAMETAESCPDALLVAETKREAGACWAALGDETRARAAWKDASKRFGRAGALRDQALVDQLLSELGSPP